MLLTFKNASNENWKRIFAFILAGLMTNGIGDEWFIEMVLRISRGLRQKYINRGLAASPVPNSASLAIWGGFGLASAVASEDLLQILNIGNSISTQLKLVLNTPDVTMMAT